MKTTPHTSPTTFSGPAVAALTSSATVGLIAVLNPTAAAFVAGGIALAATALVSAGTTPPQRPVKPADQRCTRASTSLDPGIGVATVQTVDRSSSAGTDAEPPEVTVDVETVTGQHFRGHLTHRGSGQGTAHTALRPGVVLAVRFDPRRPEEVTLADDIVAARAAFDTMLIRKGLTTADKLDLIRRGIRSRAVVTAMKPTGRVCEDYRQVELDVMVSRPEGGQFPAHEVTFIPDTSVATVEPGNVIDTYYRSADHSHVAVCVPRR